MHMFKHALTNEYKWLLENLMQSKSNSIDDLIIQMGPTSNRNNFHIACSHTSPQKYQTRLLRPGIKKLLDSPTERTPSLPQGIPSLAFTKVLRTRGSWKLPFMFSPKSQHNPKFSFFPILFSHQSQSFVNFTRVTTDPTMVRILNQG